MFSAGENVSLVWAEKFIKCGAVVIDNTNAFRREQSVPLVAPEINGKMLKNQKLISIPNCSTIQLAVVVHELQKLINVKKLIVSTYQSVSGAGKQALLDLQQHKTNVFKEGINKNIIPQIGVVGENGFCLEEDKIMFELNKILKTNIEVFAATVRVPIPNCHGESVYVEFDSEPNLTEIIKQLKNVPHIKFLENEVAVPTKCVGLNTTFVCRLRKTSKNSIMFFIVADNLRRGAAFNAFKIIEGLF